MKLLKTFGETKSRADAAIQQLEQRGAINTARVDTTVRTILADVRERGDSALREIAVRLDELADQPLLVTPEEMRDAWDAISEELKAALRLAQANIRLFAERQLPKAWSLRPLDGMEVGQIVRPLGSVGCYVPGGRYPLPSTLLMTTTPAQVAGVERIVVCSPKPAQETLAAAHLAGVTEFYRIGGAQAIAALAYGTETIEPVAKIVGPGNLYVTAAKIAVSHDTGIDMPAGPTEIVVTSEYGDPIGIAADLVAQAEHDPEALAILITTNADLADAVALEVQRQSQGNAIAEESIAAQGFIFITETVADAQALTNRLAPEHLTVDAGADLRWVKNAGSVFIGHHTPQSMGDYISGPNHVLPTGRNGRIRGGLSVLDFVKIITVQQYTRDALREVGPHAIALAEAEGLTAHAESVRVRMR
ncbi:MAG TPA: histidinol dehydrogenase [Acidobacteriaceae bacterium]